MQHLTILQFVIPGVLGVLLPNDDLDPKLDLSLGIGVVGIKSVLLLATEL